MLRWVLALALVSGFLALALAARGDSVLRGDVRLARWVQGRNWPGLDGVMDAANWSARSAPVVMVAVLISVALAWRRHWDEAAVVLAAVVIMHASYPLKEWIASPRPTPDLISVPDSGGGYGFPGGRSGNAVLFAGVLVWLLTRHVDRRWVNWIAGIVAGTWVVLVGMARVWAGAHWPSDVLGSWLWTLAVLLVLTWAAGRWRDRRQRSTQLPE